MTTKSEQLQAPDAACFKVKYSENGHRIILYCVSNTDALNESTAGRSLSGHIQQSLCFWLLPLFVGCHIEGLDS